MQVQERKSEKLLREYVITVPAKDVESKMAGKLKALGARAKIPGFRPGHIPVKILKQRYGKSVMGEVLEETVNQASQEHLKEQSHRPAMQPKIEVGDFAEGKDLEFTISYELLPEMPEVDASKLKLEKLEFDIPEKDIEEGIERIASQQKSFDAKGKSAKAKKGDAVRIDFKGFVDGEAFEGGEAKGHTLELGSGQFIPGFEDQLEGTKAGDEVTVKVTFPAEYKADLAGKDAEFKVTVHEVLEPKAPKLDDELAKTLGLESLDKLKEAVESQLRNDYEQIARTKLKKQLFDAMDETYKFEAPEGMVKSEFDTIWGRLQEAIKNGEESLKDKPEDELRAEYEEIAERRVRLGLLLADVGQKNHIKINQDELSKAVMDQARMFPGQEAKIFEFYQQHPQQLEELKGPILEEKAVDFLVEKAEVKSKKISIEELLAEDEEESGNSTKGKKTAAKKTDSKKKASDSKAKTAKKEESGDKKKPAKASTKKKTA